MSIQAVAWVLDHSKSRGVARLVLISLANHNNGGTGQCNPGQRRIAQEAGIGVGTVPLAIGRLVELGELEIIDPGGSHRSARYRLPFAHDVSEDGPKVRSSPEQVRAAQGERSARPRGEQNRKNQTEPSDSASRMQAAAEIIYAENAERIASLDDFEKPTLPEDFFERVRTGRRDLE